MHKMWPPQDQVFWYLNRPSVAPCSENMHADVVIIGGGMAGLSAAQAFHKKGKKVILLEQYYCGSGASGKSSGFITPNTELSLTEFSNLFNKEAASGIWALIEQGVADIRANIQQYHFDCDYVKQNTLVVANNPKDFKELEQEYHNLAERGYKTSLYTEISVQEKIGSKKYFGGVSYEDTFGISAYRYCQSMKDHLQKEGVLIFEETPVTKIDNHTLTTAHATITADYIIVCGDRFLPDLGLLQKQVYHAQTFLMISQQLTAQQIKTIFPDDNLMVWDTELFYPYFRMTGENRLLLGGSSLLTTYASHEQHNHMPMVRKLTSYFETKFPGSNIQFEQIWPGLVGVSKDIAPIAGRDKDNSHIYYITAAAGLPVAAGLGRYSAENLLEGRTDLDAYLSPYRSFPIRGIAQSILGNKLSFALSNYITKLTCG